MKCLLPVLLLASLGLAQVWGPAGIPLVWDFGIISVEADTLEASVAVVSVNGIFSGHVSADSVEADHGLFGVNLSSPLITSPSATSYLSMAGDTLFITLTGASADRDIVTCYVEEDGTKHCIEWNDGIGWFETSEAFRSTKGFYAGNAFYGPVSVLGAASHLFDPNNSGAGTLQLGETGDNDTTRVVGPFQSDNISSQGATSYLSFTSSAAADSLVWTQTQASGDNDMVFKWVDDSGDAYNLFLDDANDWLQFPASAFGNLITPDDAGMVAIFDRDVTSTPADGTAQGVILRVDTVDVLSAGALADGSGSVDSVFVEFHGDVITESGYYGWTGSWVNAESDTVKVENGIIYDVVSP